MKERRMKDYLVEVNDKGYVDRVFRVKTKYYRAYPFKTSRKGELIEVKDIKFVTLKNNIYEDVYTFKLSEMTFKNNLKGKVVKVDDYFVEVTEDGRFGKILKKVEFIERVYPYLNSKIYGKVQQHKVKFTSLRTGFNRNVYSFH